MYGWTVVETFSKGARTLDCQKVSCYIFPLSCVCSSPSVWFISSDYFSPTASLAPSSSPVSLLLKVVPSSCWNHTKKVFSKKSNRCSKEFATQILSWEKVWSCNHLALYPLHSYHCTLLSISWRKDAGGDICNAILFFYPFQYLCSFTWWVRKAVLHLSFSGILDTVDGTALVCRFMFHGVYLNLWAPIRLSFCL